MKDRTQHNRLTLKFIEDVGLGNDHCTATLIDLVAGHKKSQTPLADLQKASLYLLRILEKFEIKVNTTPETQEEEQVLEKTGPSHYAVDQHDEEYAPTGTKVLRTYDSLF